MSYKLFSLICASCLPFLFSLHGDFVFDDSEAVIKNKDVSSESWIDPFYNDFWGTDIKSNLSHKSYRPLTILTFKLNYLLNDKKFSAVQFKITNLLCHIACSMAVWKSFERILNGNEIKNQNKARNNVPFFAAFTFAVHPVHVEAVCGIVGRADLLAGLTFFLAFLAYNKAINVPRFTYLYLSATVIFTALSMLFKENGITALGFCICYELVMKLERKTIKTKTKAPFYRAFHIYLPAKSVRRILFLIIALALLLYIRWTVMGGIKPEFKPIDNPASFSNDLFTRIATHNYIYLLNLVLFIWPQWLCYDWSMGCVPLITNWKDPRLIFVLLMYLYGILLVTLLGRLNSGRNQRVILLAISLAIIPFLPAANIFYSVGFVIAERILYIPSAGYCLLFAVGLNKLINTDKGKIHKISIVFLSFLILTHGLKSWQRSYDWQHEYQLFVTGLAVCPLNAKVHYNVAKVADAKQHTDWALREYKEAIRLYPEYYQAMNNLANLLKNQKQYPEAEIYLRKAISLKQDFPAAWMNLGIVLGSVGRYNESLNAYKNALLYRKKYPDCLYNLGNLYLEMNKTEEAKENWFKAINLNPGHVLAWTNLLALLDNTGQLEQALKLVPEVLTELSDSASVNFAIANIYGKVGRYREAKERFKKAIQLFDKKVQAIHYANLGVLYHRWKKYELAKEMYMKALSIDPLFKSAHRNLKNLQKFHKLQNR